MSPKVFASHLISCASPLLFCYTHGIFTVPTDLFSFSYPCYTFKTSILYLLSLYMLSMYFLQPLTLRTRFCTNCKLQVQEMNDTSWIL
jgi:hypothetical protein